MPRKDIKILSSCIAIVFIFLTNESCFAKLGEHESSVKHDLQEMNYESLEEDSGVPTGARESTVRVHILKKKHGVVREYLNQDGLVFAVVWQGNTHPDLSKLLGSYYEEYRNTEKKHRHHRRGQGPQNTRTTKMLVHRSGHMRSLTGRAICPILVPKNFDLGSLK